jgi:hypothetical protein
LAAQVKEQGGEYVLALKENHASLYNEVSKSTKRLGQAAQQLCP